MLNDPRNSKEFRKLGYINIETLKKHIPQLRNNPFSMRVFRIFTKHNEAIISIPAAGNAAQNILFDRNLRDENIDKMSSYNLNVERTTELDQNNQYHLNETSSAIIDQGYSIPAAGS